MRFLHVAFGFEKKPIPAEDVQRAIGKAGWARYAPNCWIVVTDESVESLTERLHTLCKNDDSLFVCELNIRNHSGWLQKELWEWIKQARKQIG